MRAGGIAPGRAWAEHLFVVGAITSRDRAQQQASAAAGQPLIMIGVHPPIAGRVRRLRARSV